MTLKSVGLLLGGLALLALLGVAGYTAIEQFKARVQLEAKLEITNSQLAQLQAAFKSSQQETPKRIQAVKDKAAKVTTPEQAIAAIPDLTGLPITFHPVQGLPEYGLAPEDVLVLFRGLAECKEKDILLGACQVERANLEKQTTILTDQRDSAVTAVRGGTFWQKLWKNTKLLVIGGGVGVAAGYAIAHH